MVDAVHADIPTPHETKKKQVHVDGFLHGAVR